MLTKILLTAAVILGVLIVLPWVLRGRGAARPGPTPPARVEDLVRCPACGTYRGLHDPCGCGAHSTPKR
ncbi:MAG: hypothetical protein RQ752_09635 [Thermohalobaculum sp.]|nr:hypothetical protein [Thermohalobaculum sp.]